MASLASVNALSQSTVQVHEESNYQSSSVGQQQRMFILADDDNDIEEVDQHKRHPCSTIETANFHGRRCDKSVVEANGKIMIIPSQGTMDS